MRDGGDYFIRKFRNENNGEVSFHGSWALPQKYILYFYIFFILLKKKSFFFLYILHDTRKTKFKLYTI